MFYLVDSFLGWNLIIIGICIESMAKGNYPSSLLTRGLFQDSIYLCCFQQNMTRRNP